MPVYPGALLFADQPPSKRFLHRDTLVSMPIPYYQIDSFANELFAGNPAGICGHYSSRWLERQQRIFDNCQHDSIRGVPEHSQRPPEAAKSFRYSSGKPPSTKERLRAQLAAKCTNTAWRTSASLLPEF